LTVPDPDPDPDPHADPVLVRYPDESTCRQKCPEDAASPGNLMLVGPRNAATRLALDPE
jgi:hypothetical protein